MRSIRAVVVLVLALAVAGCATMFASGSETVRLESEPTGATVTTQNGITLGVTPLTTNLQPDNYVLRFTKDGYQDTSFALNKKVDGIAFLNLLCVLCWGIDFATGALWGLDEDFARVTLAPEQPNAMALACENYAALDETAEQGIIAEDVRERGDALIHAATGVTRSLCSESEA